MGCHVPSVARRGEGRNLPPSGSDNGVSSEGAETVTVDAGATVDTGVTVGAGGIAVGGVFVTV